MEDPTRVDFGGSIPSPSTPITPDTLSTSGGGGATNTTPQYYQQHPNVQAQLKAHRSLNANHSTPDQPEIPHQPLPSMSFSPFPFPPSEHPLPPRNFDSRPSPRSLTIPLPLSLSVPFQPPQFSEQFPSPSPSYPSPPPSGNSNGTALPQSIDYRFPPPTTTTTNLGLYPNHHHHRVQFVSNPNQTPPPPPTQPQFYPPPQFPHNFVAGQYSIPAGASSINGAGGGRRRGPSPQVLTPFGPLPIRHLEGGAGSSSFNPRQQPQFAQSQSQMRPSYMDNLVPSFRSIETAASTNLVRQPPPRHFFPTPTNSGLPTPRPRMKLPRHYNNNEESAPVLEEETGISPSRPQSCVDFVVSGGGGSEDVNLSSSPDEYSHHQFESKTKTKTKSNRPHSAPASPNCQTPVDNPLSNSNLDYPPHSPPSSTTLRETLTRSQSSPNPETGLPSRFTLPPPGGILPAIPRELQSTIYDRAPPPHPDQTTTLIANCEVEGCKFPRFCSLSPCGDSICRDHLGSVIRGVRMVPKMCKVKVKVKRRRTSPESTRKEQKEEQGEEEMETETEREVEEMVKVYECVKCRKQSEMVGPTMNQQQHRDGKLFNGNNNYSNLVPPRQSSTTTTNEGLGIDFEGGGGSRHREDPGFFSIHYFSSGPTGGGGGGLVGSDHFPRFTSNDFGNDAGNQRRRNSERETRALGPAFIESVYPFPSGQSHDNYDSGVIPKPPSPPYPLQFQPPLPERASDFSFSPPELRPLPPTTYYHTPFGLPYAPTTTLGTVIEKREDVELGPTPEVDGLVIETKKELVDDGADDDEVNCPAVSFHQTSPFDVVESQTVQPLLPSPPTIPNRSIPSTPLPSQPRPSRWLDDSSSSVVHHAATREDAIHLLEEDPSIVCVSSTSPPTTPFQQTQPLPPLPAEPESEQAVDSPVQLSPAESLAPSIPVPTLPSPHPTSEYFSNYSWSSSPTRGGGGKPRGRGGFIRGSGRGRRGGYDPTIHGPYRSSFRERRTSQVTAAEEDGEEEGQDSIWNRRGSKWGEYERPPYQPYVAPEDQLEMYRTKRVESDVRSSDFYVIKVENIPFSTTYRDVEDWLPENVLPRFENCPQPIHLILHRASGRTLPHCYIELKDHDSALLLLIEYDRSVLGNRNVRVKMERVGELMRDLFDQHQYFNRSSSYTSPAKEPLPQFPVEGYSLPDRVLDEVDLEAFSMWFSTGPWSLYSHRPSERGYTHLGSILSKFPFETRAENWTEYRDRLYMLACRAISLAKSTRGPFEASFSAIGDRLIEIVAHCPGFTRSQRSRYTTFSIDDFPPLSSPVRSTTPRKQPSRDAVPSAHPSAAAWGLVDSSSPENTTESTLQEDPSPELAPPPWLKSNSSSSARLSRTSDSNEHPFLCWADEPFDLESDRVTAQGTPDLDHSPVTVPRSAWFDASGSNDRTFSPTSSDSFTEYPLTPPESPEVVRSRYSSSSRGESLGYSPRARGRGRARGKGVSKF
ncbi:uncharacterized protein JCM6883_006086 [Sporobolomyces salmoneus]|uniref:uncharacterized protein n=1 Tax=Sporobolomyces salmoneus TaxID=183962 RepID=UPI003173E1FA